MKLIIEEYGGLIIASIAVIIVSGIAILYFEQLGSIAKTILHGIIGR